MIMEDTAQIPDPALFDYQQIDLALAGDQMAFRTLFNRYRKNVFYRILRMVRDEENAKDLTMEVFSKAFANLFRFQKRHRFSTWLYRIGINHTLDFIRKKRLPTHALPLYGWEDNHEFDASPASRPVASENPALPLEREERARVIAIHLFSLPPHYRQLIDLRYYHDYTYQEIAEAMHLPLGTVKSYLHHGRKMLRRQLCTWRKNE
jgi:RNA polymerase sigma-70 factor (ECF subfamily)